MDFEVGDPVELDVNGTWYPGYISRRDWAGMAYFKYDASRFRMYCEPLDTSDPDDAARLRRAPRTAKRAAATRAKAAEAPATKEPVAKAKKPAARKAKAPAKKKTVTS